MNQIDNIRNILEGAPDGIVIINKKGEIILVNTQTEVLFNYKRDELLGKSIEILLPESYRELNVSNRNDFLKNPTIGPMRHPGIDLKGKRKDGSEFNVEISLSPLYTDKKELVIIASIRDISERIQMEEKLKASQTIFKKIFESSFTGIMKLEAILDESGDIVDFKYDVVNRRAKELLQVKDDAFFQNSVLTNFPFISSSEIFTIMKRVVKTGNSELHEFSLQIKGVNVWYKSNTIKLDGGLIITFDDISFRKEAEKKLKELNAELEKGISERTRELTIANKKLKGINEKLDRYAYMISHDLKAPLANIEGIATFIEEDYSEKPMDDEGKEMLDMMKTKINDMRDIIENVLQSAKDEIKNREIVNLVQIAQQVIDSLNPPAHFHIFIQDNLPHIKYSRTSIFQILQNLLSNAIKYMDKPNPLITISFTENEKFYLICVTDNGRGIPENKLKEIFTLFEVAHPDECEFDSHGIGLTIVKQLVEENGGKIWVESEFEKETKFHFTVPKK